MSCARAMRKSVKGTYRTMHKKVVSNFNKERMVQIDFLNPPEQYRLPSFCRMSLFFRQITSGWLRNLYESLRTS